MGVRATPLTIPEKSFTRADFDYYAHWETGLHLYYHKSTSTRGRICALAERTAAATHCFYERTPFQMPTLACPDLGRFDFREEEVLSFPEGLPAFENMRRFLLAQREGFAPFLFLVSVDLPAVRFVCVPVCVLDPDYRFEIAPGDGVAMGLKDGLYSAASPNPLLLAIVTLSHSGLATANMASPLVVDAKRRFGVQVILPGGAYSHATPLQPPAVVEQSC